MVIQDQVFQYFTTFLNKDDKRYQRCNFCAEEMAGHDRRRLMEHIHTKCKNAPPETSADIGVRYANIYRERNRRKAALAARRDAGLGLWDDDDLGLDSDVADVAAPRRGTAGLRPVGSSSATASRMQGGSRLDQFLASVDTTPYGGGAAGGGGASRDLDFEAGMLAPGAKVPIPKALEAQRLLQLFLEQQGGQTQEDRLLYRLLVRRELRLEEQLKAGKLAVNNANNVNESFGGEFRRVNKRVGGLEVDAWLE